MSGDRQSAAPDRSRRTFVALGVSHSTSAQAVRDKAFFTAHHAAFIRARLCSRGVEGVVVLSTCNRSEIFFFSPPGAVEDAVRAYIETFSGAVADGDVRCRVGEDAIRYFFRIASGIESMVFGEYQILGQVRAACAEARASGPVTGALDLVLRDCITCARRVRTTLDLGAVAPSVCRAAMDAVDARGGIAGKRVFVIGSGRTGSLAAELAVERGARSLSVCNRSPERAAHLVSEFGARMVAYESRYGVISQSDTVVCATSSPHTVVSADFVELSRPVMFVDLASPRDVDPRLAESGLVTIVDLDSIGAMCRGDLAELSGLEKRAGMIVDAAVAETASAVEARI